LGHYKVVAMEKTAEVVQIDKNKEKSPSGWHKYWAREMDSAQKRIKEFVRQGNNVNALYLDEEADKVSLIKSRLNLFYTNVSTTQAMLYGNNPAIDVSREHADPDDDIARVAATLFQRLLETNETEELSEPLKQALQDRLIPGLGVARVRYDYEEGVQTVINSETLQPEETPKTESEESCIDYVHWQDFTWGWARSWKAVPWVGFRSWLVKDEVVKRFTEKVARNLEYKKQLPGGDTKDETNYNSEDASESDKAEIWEIWDKKTKKVYWYSEGADLILDIKDDPLELMNFFPMPRPLTANLTTTLFMPKSDYLMHQDLYRETDVLYNRITIITRAIKVVGVYDKNQTSSVGRMLKEGSENALIPVDNWAMFAEKGGLKGTVEWFPVQDIANTLVTLRQLLGENIELLSQTTGLSNLMAGGNTDQYTSDGTNQLTAKFGSIRVQALQDEFARFASELEMLRAEVISKHYSPESILIQSNAKYLPPADHQKIMPAVELMQAPDVQWRIAIRPESLAMMDYAQLKQERTEYLNAMATYIQSAQAMVKSVPESLPILMEMLKWGMAGFKGSDVMEGMMDQAIDMAKNMPPAGQDDGKEKAMQGQMAIIQAQSQAELQKIQAKSQADGQLAQMKFQGELQKVNADNQANLAEIQAKSNADMQKIATDLRADMQVIAAKLDSSLRTEEAQSLMSNAESQAQHAYDLEQENVDHQNTMDQIEATGKNRDSGED
jgi:hypothetical protein